MRILRLREVARMTARIALEFAPEKYHDSVAFATGCKRIKNSKQCNRKIRIPIAMWPCRVEEKMTLKEVDGQTLRKLKQRSLPMMHYPLEFLKNFKVMKRLKKSQWNNLEDMTCMDL
ncbi:hypothetical protein Tco_0795192 [Tanacetum coccineum]